VRAALAAALLMASCAAPAAATGIPADSPTDALGPPAIYTPCGADCGSTLPPGQTVAVPTAPPAPTPAPPPDAVTYHCSGSAPDGIDISYGTDSSHFSASRLPFTKTAPLDATAEYYSLSGQLQGAGSVTCTLTVAWTPADGDGTQSRASKTGTGEGGYNLATVEVCHDPAAIYGSQEWEAC